MPHDPVNMLLSRRELLRRSGLGFGMLGLAGLVAEPAAAATSADFANPTAPKVAHFPARAKHVIHLFMNGGPSHVDTFDPKPQLTARHGQELPINLPTERKTGSAFASPFKFKPYGQSGIEVSELFSHVAES